MILEKQTEAHILQEGESQDTVKMSLDLDSAQVLMQMLSKNLYSDSIGSTIRECASNALDSHRRAGSDKPIIVSFKRNNQADTYEFAVEDFGIGLDADDVVNIISKYGKSTKRDSNTELGMMGLGFKAPLAYSSSFYFVARKNGMERKYMMYEGEDTNSIDLLYEKPTTEENGVKVIVPVNYYDRYNFTQKIKEQLAYFENVYFDVDQSIGHSVSNDFVIYRAEHFQFSSMATNNTMHLCLDNVSYPIDWEKLGIDRINIKIALRFSLSDGLFPTPNREAIRYTQEAKQVILKKIAQVADVFMEKFNESISDNANIDAIMSFYGDRNKYLPSFYRKDEDKVQIDELIKHATVPMKQPKLEGVELLDLQRLAEKAKDYMLSEYQIKYRYQGNRFNNAKNYWTTNLRLNDLNSYNSGKVYIFSDRLTKTKQDYMRSLLGDNSKCHLFVKKDKPFKLMNGQETDYNKYYHSVLGLRHYPKSQWRQLIKEFQYVISLYAKDFIDVDAIDIPQTWVDAQKAKRMKVLASPVTVNGVKKVRMKGEFSGKVGTATEIQYTDRFAKFVPTTFKLEDIHRVKQLHVYAKEEDREKLDKLWSIFNNQAKFVIVAQATIDNLKKADLHNWITLDKFMEGKNRPFKTMATKLLIEDLVTAKRATFTRINVVSDISKDLGEKLKVLDEYNRINGTRSYADDTTKKTIIEHAIENNLFDQPIYMVYKQVNEVFTKLPFLNTLMDKMGYRDSLADNPMMQAIIDLFKYHKQKVNLEHYTIKLTEDAVLEETLTEDTINELQTI